MDDSISRQAAIDAVEESRRLNHHQDGKEACAHEYEHRHFLKILMELPPDRENAHWVWDENAIDWGLGAWVCSVCRCRNDNIKAQKDINPLMWVGSKYCPQCGAKMGEKKMSDLISGQVAYKEGKEE